ncbi:hypothetical protein MASR1M66_01640 [Aminivibrio sp.]
MREMPSEEGKPDEPDEELEGVLYGLARRAIRRGEGVLLRAAEAGNYHGGLPIRRPARLNSRGSTQSIKAD